MTDIDVLSELRSNYNLFNADERPYYHALSEAIKALNVTRHGHWIVGKDRNDDVYVECSECGQSFYFKPGSFCSACGAKMDEAVPTHSNEFNTLKALEIPRAYWEIAIGYDPRKAFMCSECRLMSFENTRFCPHCGRRMNEEWDTDADHE